SQEVLALLLLGAGLDVVADPLADLEFGEPLALELNGELEPAGDIDGLEQPALVIDAQVGAVAGAVGERAGLGDRAQERRTPTVVAADLEDLLDHRAVLALELLCALVGGRSVVDRLDLDQQATVGARNGCPGVPAMESGEGRGGDVAREHAGLD